LGEGSSDSTCSGIREVGRGIVWLEGEMICCIEPSSGSSLNPAREFWLRRLKPWGAVWLMKPIGWSSAEDFWSRANLSLKEEGRSE